MSQTCNPEKKPYVSSLYSLSPPIKKFYIDVTSGTEKKVYYNNMGKSPYTNIKDLGFLFTLRYIPTNMMQFFVSEKSKTGNSSKRIIEEVNINIDEIGNSGFVRTE